MEQGIGTEKPSRKRRWAPQVAHISFEIPLELHAAIVKYREEANHKSFSHAIRALFTIALEKVNG